MPGIRFRSGDALAGLCDSRGEGCCSQRDAPCPPEGRGLLPRALPAADLQDGGSLSPALPLLLLDPF